MLNEVKFFLSIRTFSYAIRTLFYQTNIGLKFQFYAKRFAFSPNPNPFSPKNSNVYSVHRTRNSHLTFNFEQFFDIQSG